MFHQTHSKAKLKKREIRSKIDCEFNDMFKLKSPFKAAGDQPEAIKKLRNNLESGENHQVLLGVTGSGKTFTMASVIQKTQRPALVVSPNKILAAQLYQEFKEFFPNNAVHYFVSYYDYYQPEAYIPQTDTYIEKDAKINEAIDRMRHEATQDALNRKDVIVVASVSCIYNIGSPENYQKASLEIKKGQKISRKEFISHLIALQYQRNDIDFKPATFRVRGDIVDVYLVTAKQILRIEFNEGKIENISFADNPLDTKYRIQDTKYTLYPATFWVAPKEKFQLSLQNIKSELQERLQELKKQKKLLEAQRLETRTNYDLEMMQEAGYCHGIENYSRHMEFREPGTPPYTLIDYLPKNFLLFIDESHITLPQIRAMAVQDRARKNVLIEHGFRLASAVDNRPLTFEEFSKKTKQTIYVSATPNEYELQKSVKNIVEQIIRPTGLLEPEIEIRPAKNQVEDLISEIKKCRDKKQRVLALILTKKLAQALSDYLIEAGVKSQWLHSEIKTLERPQILNDLREGKYDVLVGINLLREGLDLPEVSLVAILDADKEGFLRSKTTLIQTMGRAARSLEGRVILYADKTTGSMKGAIKEINRRRKIQLIYNKAHNIKPKTILKAVREWQLSAKKEVASEFQQIKDKKLLEKEMLQAAKNLDFERAAEIRDLIKNLKSV